MLFDDEENADVFIFMIVKQQLEILSAIGSHAIISISQSSTLQLLLNILNFNVWGIHTVIKALEIQIFDTAIIYHLNFGNISTN